MSPIRLGAFVVATLAVLVGGIFLIGSKNLSFRSTYRVKTEFQNVAGLSDGAEVRVGGIHEGTVTRIELPHQPDGKVTVEMDLASATKDVVKKDSTASIQSEGLVGDKYVEVSFGSKAGGALQDGDTIASQPPLEMTQLFKKTDDILNEARDALQSIDSSSKDLQSISAKINGGSGTVGQLVNNSALYKQATAGATALHEDAEALKHNFLLRGFFKNRGYEDAADLAKHEIQQLPSGASEKKFEYEGNHLFDKSDSAKLKNEKSLKEVGQFLQGNPFGLVVVQSLSGMKGDAKTETQLTQARAAVVREYLVKNYRLDDTRIKTMGLGKNQDVPDGGLVRILVYPKTAESQPGTERH